jgi:hypothetical protein
MRARYRGWRRTSTERRACQGYVTVRPYKMSSVRVSSEKRIVGNGNKVGSLETNILQVLAVLPRQLFIANYYITGNLEDDPLLWYRDCIVDYRDVERSYCGASRMMRLLVSETAVLANLKGECQRTSRPYLLHTCLLQPCPAVYQLAIGLIPCQGCGLQWSRLLPLLKKRVMMYC